MAPEKDNITFNAMVRFLLKNYNIPTRKNFDKINTHLDRIEKIVKAMNRAPSLRGSLRGRVSQPRMSASNEVFDVIKEYKEGVNFAEIQKRTGFNDKKIRNIIFRLDKLGKIKRIRRGIYVAQS